MTEFKKDLFSKTLSQKSTSMSSDITQYDSFSSQISTLHNLSSLIKKKQVQCLSAKSLSKEEIITMLKQMKSTLESNLKGQEEEKEILYKNVYIYKITIERNERQNYH